MFFHREISHTVPDISIHGNLSSVHCSLDLCKYKLIRGLLENNLGEPIEEFMRPYDLQDPRIHVSVTLGSSVTLVVSWSSSCVSVPQSQLAKEDGATSKLDFMTLTPFLDWQLWIDRHFPFPDCSEWRSIHVHVFPHWYGKCKSGTERSKRKRSCWVPSQVWLWLYGFTISNGNRNPVHLVLSCRAEWPSGGSQLNVVCLQDAFWLVCTMLFKSLNSSVTQDSWGYAVVIGTPKYQWLRRVTMFFSSCFLSIMVLGCSAHCSYPGWQSSFLCQWEEPLSGLEWQWDPGKPCGARTWSHVSAESGSSLPVCLCWGSPELSGEHWCWWPRWPELVNCMWKSLDFSFLWRILSFGSRGPVFSIRSIWELSGSLGNL